ncbi:MAG: phosphonate ABC transporter, permease protein PhnE [bacterium]|nr:phosphonate ABC transporter, permease protein PhnE [bacterium]
MSIQTKPAPRPPQPTPAEVERDARTLAPPSGPNMLAGGIILTLLAIAVWSVWSLGISPQAILNSIDNARDFFSRMWPLDFPPIGELWQMTALTLAIVVCATLLAVILSTVVAVFAAHTTSPGPRAQGIARVIIVVCRALPELVLVVIFVRIFGFGTIAGILAMGLHSVGMVGKMYADAIEDADDGPRRALEAAGATRLQQVMGATLPGILPAMIATGLHRFDINLRVSVILGWVGVSGIGQSLQHALSTQNYQRGMALAVVILALCITVELISGAIRAKLLGRDRARKDRRLAGVKPSSRAPEPPVTDRRISPPWTGERVARHAYLLLTALIVLLSIWYADVNWGRFFEGFVKIPDVAGQFLPPSPGTMSWSTIWAQLGITLQIAFAATLLGALMALPVGFLAARNVAPNLQVAQFFRMVIVVVRGIPELILAIVFVVISGMGPIAGTFALAIGAMGLLSKLVADSIEETDIRVQEALRANGASRVQVFFGATIRQAMPAIVAHVIYQLDVNFRSATLLGIVGAGGIGFYIENARRVLQFEVITLILVLVIAIVLILEGIAILLRKIVR